MTLDLVTVVYEDDLHLLQTQALSIQQTFEYDDLNNIHIVVNDLMFVCEKVKKEWYGKFYNKVVIWDNWCYSVLDFAPPYASREKRDHGWKRQQALKLLAVSKSTADWTIVLDAKTWFVKKFHKQHFFDHQNRARTTLWPTPIPFQKGQDFCRSFIDALQPCDSQGHFSLSPVGVPFFMKPWLVKSMIDYLNPKFNNLEFLAWFMSPCYFPFCMTEFVLYSEYVARVHGFENFYNFNYSGVVRTVWNFGQSDSVEKFVNFIESVGTPTTDHYWTVSIHPHAHNRLSLEQKAQWNRYLQTNNLLLV